MELPHEYTLINQLVFDGDTDMSHMKTSSFHQSRKRIQSVATRIGFTTTVGMCYRPKIILYELHTQVTL